METLICRNTGGQIPAIEGIEYFLNRSIIIYGPSNSGKSVIITHIMKQLQDKIPNVVIICPTNNVNNVYTGLVPNQLIHSEVKKELIDTIVKKQEAGLEIYNDANDINKLFSIFEFCASDEEKFKYNNFVSAYKDMEKKLILDDGLHQSIKTKKLKELKGAHETNMRDLFKTVINSHRERILCSNASDMVKRIVKYLYYNPNILLIMDDVGGDATTWGKFKEIRKLFFQGRHYHITFIIALQDEVMLNKDLRTNSFINIFTKESVVSAYFERKTNAYSTREQKLYKGLAKTIFNSEDKEVDKYGNVIENFKKLCYIRDGCDFNIYYMLATMHDKFKFGSTTLWKICSSAQKTGGGTSDNELKKYF